ncbi:outer membrane beta-barrel protein [Chryseobacterium kwangjuense]|uniref:outer membrane beta-barrel protein n=1 Tax=Chryseobacterium kwangjuense TaxID=267125 RepID=UPI0012FE9BEC|nr:outer membrane beta-barrel protein [Chryseobacterium kwangjuense]
MAQEKRKVDTVYVYEKVVVYDTIYVDKAIPLKPANLLSSSLEIKEKEIRDGKQQNINKKEVEKQIEKTSDTRFQYGIRAGIGFKNVSWAENISSKKQQFGEHIGIWVSKNVFTPQLSLSLSANVFYWHSTFNLDATKEDTPLNGFYFTQDQQPLMFQRFNNKHFEYVLQLKAIYQWKIFRPSVGFSINKNIYKMQFLVPENQILNKLDDFKSNQINIGFSLGLQYQISSRFLIDLEYQHYKINHFSLKNTSFDFDFLKTNNTFAESKISLGISYLISRL